MGLNICLCTEASRYMNYQGEVWYRKRSAPADALKGKKLFLHFKAIMGKSKVLFESPVGKRAFGGFLPVVVKTNALKWGEDNVIGYISRQ